MAIKLTDFKGEIPRRQRSMLPQGFAETSKGARLESGALAPYRASSDVLPVTAATQSIYRHKTDWLLFDTLAHAVVGPVADERLYIMGDGAPKVRIAGTTYPLALPAPEDAPDLTPLNPQIIPEPDDPDEAIDLSDFDAGEPDDPPPGTGPGVPAKLALVQAPEFEEASGGPLNFVRREAPVTVPAILNILDENDVIVQVSNLRVTVSIVGSGARLYAVTSSLSQNGVITLGGFALSSFFGASDVVLRFSADGLGSVDYTVGSGAISPEAKTPFLPGEPYRIVVVREPEGSVSGYPLQVQPAIVLVDYYGDICETTEGYEVSVRSSRNSTCVIQGPRKAQSVDGLVRFRDLKVSAGEDDDCILEFFAEGLLPAESESFNVTPDREKVSKDILFVYTFVTEFDEESPPSPASAALSWYPSLEVEVAGFSAPVAGRGVDRIRIYRSETTLYGLTDLYFLAEVALPVTSFEYVEADFPLAEIIRSNDYDPPEDEFEGIISMPNGMMAAYSGRELAFCEPYIPHAWPIKYRLTVDSEIRGLVAMGSTLAILTADRPYVAQGLHPSAMAIEKLDQSVPCVSKKSVVDLGYSAAFVTHRGIAVFGQGQGLQLITDSLFTKDQWRRISPDTVVAAAYDGKYLFSFIPKGETDRECGLIDLSGTVPFYNRLHEKPRAFFEDPQNGELYFVSDATNQIRLWDDPNEVPLDYVWKSSLLRSNALQNFAALIVRTDTPNHASSISFDVDVFADGVKIATISQLDQPVRLPSGFLAQDWQFEARGNAVVTEISVAGAISDLLQ